MTKSFVIFSNPLDAHAQAIVWALRKLDCRANLISLSDLPDFADSFCNLEKLIWRDNEVEIDIESCDLLYWRRRWPIIAPDHAASEDTDFIVDQNEQYLDWILDYLSHINKSWLQTPSAVRNANNKLIQLRVASSVGLQIPRTLIGNCFQEIDHFIKAKDKCITKSLIPNNWKDGDQNLFTFTAAIDETDISLASVKLAPMIYQTQIPKAYEHRVMVFGEKVFSVRQDPNKFKEASVDSRIAVNNQLEYERYELPQYLQDQLISFCKVLNIKSGIFDIIETPEGEFIFLEVNESGAFLWLEMHLPDLALLREKVCLLLELMGSDSSPDQPGMEQITINNFFTEYPSENFRTPNGRGIGKHKIMIPA